jgi:hypothetical protein
MLSRKQLNIATTATRAPVKATLGKVASFVLRNLFAVIFMHCVMPVFVDVQFGLRCSFV